MRGRRRLALAAGLLSLALLASCRTTAGAGDMPSLPALKAGVQPPAADRQLTGTLVRDGDCLRIGGNGTTVVVWPRSAQARSVASDINVVVIWPRAARVRPERDSAAGINGVVIWCLSDETCAPVRIGQRVELIGGMKDDLAGLTFARPLPRGCTGRVFVAQQFRPAPAPGN